MRARSFIVSVITSLLILSLAFRKHIRDLADVGRTWGTFHAHLQRSPVVLFNFPPVEQASVSVSPSDDDAAAAGLSEPVPKIIHQIFLTQGRLNSSLNKYLPAIDSCRTLHPSWTYKLWSDANATSFISTHYPEILPHYSAYPQNIQRANILRYALLHHFGGVYLDLDITCIVPLDSPLGTDAPARSLSHLPWLTPAAHPAGVNNAFILSRPRHPLLTGLLAAVPSHDLKWGLPYVENMLSTGCMFFSEIWDSYATGLEMEWTRVRMREGWGGRAVADGIRGSRPAAAALAAMAAVSSPIIDPADRIYVLADEEGRVEPHMLRGKVTTPLFAHGGESSWHGWDAAMIVTIGKYYRALAGLALGAVALLAVGLVWRLGRVTRQRGRRRKSVMAMLGLERKLGAESWNLMSEEI